MLKFCVSVLSLAVICGTVDAQQRVCKNGVCRIVASKTTSVPKATASVSAVNHGIKLNPGEVLVSVNGVPVRNASQVKHPTGQQLVRNVSSGQAMAQQRADYMARNGYRGHPPTSAGSFTSVGGRFEGCGWTSRRNASKNSVSTCTPNRAMTLIGDAVACSQYGTFRVRIWR